MRSSVRLQPAGLALGVALAVAGCGDAVAPAGVDGALTPTPADARWNEAVPAPSEAWSAHLKGRNEVPPVATRAQGQALFRLSADGSELSYRLIVANIENVLMAHIHLAPPGVNGGVVVWLYPDGPPPQLIPGRFSGVLAEGVITAGDLVGGLAGASMDALVDAIEAGNAYVNVHTSQVPGGEIRGQIR